MLWVSVSRRLRHRHLVVANPLRVLSRSRSLARVLYLSLSFSLSLSLSLFLNLSLSFHFSLDQVGCLSSVEHNTWHQFSLVDRVPLASQTFGSSNVSPPPSPWALHDSAQELRTGRAL